MNFIIDTCTFLFLLENTLNNRIQDIIFDIDNQIFITAESIKECIHLIQFGRVKQPDYMPDSPLDVFDFVKNKLGFYIIYTNQSHIEAFAKLPIVKGHKDPIDRIIISISITENMSIISSDTVFPEYEKHGLKLIKFNAPPKERQD